MPNATDRLSAAGSLVGLGRSVQILQAQLAEEVSRTILDTPIHQLKGELSRLLGSDQLADDALRPLRNLTVDEISDLYRPRVTVASRNHKAIPRVKAVQAKAVRVKTMAPSNRAYALNIEQEGNHFSVRLPDGQVRISKRRRDLVRRVRENGYQVA